MYRIFLLSPAHCGGKRAGYLFNPDARFDLAKRLHSGGEAPLGEIFSFISGLYFRGKFAYGKHFACAPKGMEGVLTITPNCGLVSVHEPFSITALQKLATTDIEENRAEYRAPLVRDLGLFCEALNNAKHPTDVVLLGSIASDKYVEILLNCLGERLLFPKDFVGRGDLSRGGLMLRAVENNIELEYAPVLGAIRSGKRPPKLAPVKGILKRSST